MWDSSFGALFVGTSRCGVNREENILCKGEIANPKLGANRREDVITYPRFKR